MIFLDCDRALIRVFLAAVIAFVFQPYFLRRTDPYEAAVFAQCILTQTFRLPAIKRPVAQRIQDFLMILCHIDSVETVISDHVGVQAAVCAEVDILKKNADQIRADFVQDPRGIDFQCNHVDPLFLLQVFFCLLLSSSFSRCLPVGLLFLFFVFFFYTILDLSFGIYLPFCVDIIPFFTDDIFIRIIIRKTT